METRKMLARCSCQKLFVLAALNFVTALGCSSKNNDQPNSESDPTMHVEAPAKTESTNTQPQTAPTPALQPPPAVQPSVATGSELVQNGGITDGNGGSIVQCARNYRELGGKSIVALDFMEVYSKLRVLVKFDTSFGLEPFNLVRGLIKRLRQRDPWRADLYDSYLATFESEMSIEPNLYLPDPADTGIVRLPGSDCKIMLTILQGIPDGSSQVRYYVKQELWDQIDAMSKAALIMHEIIFRDVRHRWNGEQVPNGYASNYIRELNGLLMTDKFKERNEADYGIWLESRLGIPAFYVQSDDFKSVFRLGSTDWWPSGALKQGELYCKNGDEYQSDTSIAQYFKANGLPEVCRPDFNVAHVDPQFPQNFVRITVPLGSQESPVKISYAENGRVAAIESTSYGGARFQADDGAKFFIGNGCFFEDSAPIWSAGFLTAEFDTLQVGLKAVNFGDVNPGVKVPACAWNKHATEKPLLILGKTRMNGGFGQITETTLAEPAKLRTSDGKTIAFEKGEVVRFDKEGFALPRNQQ